jgi:hypothetical protein
LDETKREASGEQPAERRHRLASVRGVGEHRPGMRQECIAGRGQPDPAPVADEQPLAELRFQTANLLRLGLSLRFNPLWQSARLRSGWLVT